MMGFADPEAEFAATLAETSDSGERRAMFARWLEPFGVTCFAYANAGRHFTPFLLEATYPEEWVAHYLASGYAECDVVAIEAKRLAVPFHWRSMLERPGTSAEAHRVFDEAACYGIHDGFTVPIRRPGGLALMSLAVDDPALLKPGAVAERRSIQLMSLYYHDAVENSALRDLAESVRLTQRECEVLKWTARGKTGWEIARILQVAERTVVFHVENARAKLGAASRSQAAVKAITLGLIDP